MLRTLLTTMAIVSMVCYVGCKDSSGDPVTVTPPSDETPLTKDDSVAVNAGLVRDAAEAFAAENGGVYPHSTADQLADGRKIVDFLPDGLPVKNPYTDVRDSPRDAAAFHVGTVGYHIYTGTAPYGYIITGVGGQQGTWIVKYERNPAEP